jgi:cytochrome P450
LYALSLDQRVQSKLRAEIHKHFPTLNTSPTADELDQLDYLDIVVKEVLRLHSPAPLTVRVAVQDDILPNGVFVPKGTIMALINATMHKLPEYWGDDALSFRPERWQEPRVTEMPNLTQIYTPFLAGSRSCIGMKLALLEFKMILTCLLYAFEFRPVPGHVVHKRLQITSKPWPYIQLDICSLKVAQ